MGVKRVRLHATEDGRVIYEKIGFKPKLHLPILVHETEPPEKNISGQKRTWSDKIWYTPNN